MTEKDWNVLSDDVSKNSIETSDTLTTLVLISRMGMWGESMFGDYSLLGSGSNNTYFSNVEKNVVTSDLSWNVARRLSSLVSVSMLTRLGMWGEAMFGDEDLLGTGSLNYYEG